MSRESLYVFVISFSKHSRTQRLKLRRRASYVLNKFFESRSDAERWLTSKGFTPIKKVGKPMQFSYSFSNMLASGTSKAEIEMVRKDCDLEDFPAVLLAESDVGKEILG